MGIQSLTTRVSFCRKSLLSTLKAIHNAGVVHGDIRLANLCVNQDGQAFIIDFGRSEISSSRARMNREITELCGLLNIRDANELPRKVTAQGGLRRSARIKEAGVEHRRAAGAAIPLASSFRRAYVCPA
jgi:serine/threonine protein kinase